MHRVLADCAADDAVTPLAIIVPTSGAAEALDRTFAHRAVPRGGFDFLTRDELYARLHERLPSAPHMLTAFEREVLLTRAASIATSSGTPAPFKLRPGLIVEILSFYDELRRRDRHSGGLRSADDRQPAIERRDRSGRRAALPADRVSDGDVHTLRSARRGEWPAGRARAAPVAAGSARIRVVPTSGSERRRSGRRSARAVDRRLRHAGEASRPGLARRDRDRKRAGRRVPRARARRAARHRRGTPGRRGHQCRSL